MSYLKPLGFSGLRLSSMSISRLLAIFTLTLVMQFSVASASEKASNPDRHAETLGSLSIPKNEERLSALLLRAPGSTEHYPLGTLWISPQRFFSQQHLYRRLRLTFSDIPSEARIDHLPSSIRQTWAKWVAQQSPVGRQFIPSVDPRWLQANPDQDPVLSEQDRIVQVSRPSTVGVVLNTGGICSVQHNPHAAAIEYVRACEIDRLFSYDSGEIVQPDGRRIQITISPHSRSVQPPPAAGAYIWFPARELKWPSKFNDQLGEFLSGQGLWQDNTYQAAIPADFEPATNFRDLVVTASDWGGIGVMQTPTARFATTGNASLSYSSANPYARLNAMFTPFDWLEAGFRYIEIKDRLYSNVPEFSGNQSLKDKGIDLKIRLWPESAVLPQIAAGFRDMGGTGLFAGEYLVASKRWKDLDFSLGLGWGYLGRRGNVRNPLGLLGERFKKRPSATESAEVGGEFNVSTFFTGPAAVFGGVQYHTPWDRWIVKAEVDGNDFQSEPSGRGREDVSMPINFGVVYRPTRYAELNLGIERGNTLMFGINLHTDASKLNTPKISNPRQPQVAARPPDYPKEIPQEVILQTLKNELMDQTEWGVDRITLRHEELRVRILSTRTGMGQEMLEIATSVAHRLSPSFIKVFVFEIESQGLLLSEIRVNRNEWARAKTQYVANTTRHYHTPALPQKLYEQTPTRPSIVDQVKIEDELKRFNISTGLSFRQGFQGPEAFWNYELNATLNLGLNLSRNTWISGRAEYRLLDNYDQLKVGATSNLPQVRTLIRNYVKDQDLVIPTLQINSVHQLDDDWYGLVYAGLFEFMYAGVGGEILYRPHGSRIAYGVDFQKVRQRGFQQDFSLRDYEAYTGHASIYWDTGWNNILANLAAGQYLAGDRGLTLEISRIFDNGVRVGAWGTRTNVSARDFGEGSFDKGIFFSIPFDLMTTKSTTGSANFVWKPLTRDGGARLGRSQTLYGITGARDPRLLQ